MTANESQSQMLHMCRFVYLHFVTNRYIQGQMQVNMSYIQHLGLIGQILVHLHVRY